MSGERAGQVVDQLRQEPTIVSPDVVDRAFAPPVVASFALDSLDMRSVAALTPNGRVDEPA